MCNTDETVVQLRNLKCHFNEEEVRKYVSLKPQEFWQINAQERSLNGDLLFKNICQLAHLVMSLPHSNAESKRIFSIMKCCEVQKRNRLGGQMINSIYVLRLSLQNRGTNSHKYFRLLKNDIYKKEI